VTIKNAMLLSGVVIGVTAAAVAVDRRTRLDEVRNAARIPAPEPASAAPAATALAPHGRAWRVLLAVGIVLAIALAAFGIASDGSARLVCLNHAAGTTASGRLVCIAPRAHRIAVHYVEAAIGVLLAAAALALIADLWERRRTARV
jgi:hypothetical protein